MVKGVINALWDYSHVIWVKRYKKVNPTNDNIGSLTCIKLLQLIPKYLAILRNRLSITKRKLHLNVTRGLTKTHQQMLFKWLQLISSEQTAIL